MPRGMPGNDHRRANLARAIIDPSAGVTLAPRLELCPRCGVSKGKKSNARPGLCRDCSEVLGADRVRWAA